LLVDQLEGSLEGGVVVVDVFEANALGLCAQEVPEVGFEFGGESTGVFDVGLATDCALKENHVVHIELITNERRDESVVIETDWDDVRLHG